MDPQHSVSFIISQCPQARDTVMNKLHYINAAVVVVVVADERFH